MFFLTTTRTIVLILRAKSIIQYVLTNILTKHILSFKKFYYICVIYYTLNH